MSKKKIPALYRHPLDQHTPGPWKYDEKAGVVRDAEGVQISVTKGAHVNGHLVAQAPEFAAFISTLASFGGHLGLNGQDKLKEADLRTNMESFRVQAAALRDKLHAGAPAAVTIRKILKKAKK